MSVLSVRVCKSCAVFRVHFLSLHNFISRVVFSPTLHAPYIRIYSLVPYPFSHLILKLAHTFKEKRKGKSLDFFSLNHSHP